jgi:hypothetical protein
VTYKFRGLADYAYVPKNPDLFDESEPNSTNVTSNVNI